MSRHVKALLLAFRQTLSSALSLESRVSSAIALVVFMSVLLVTSPIMADVPRPLIPEADGKQCVEETSFMRRNHMEILTHRRDETMYNGIRTKKYSFQNCLTCHAVKDKQQKFVSIKDKRHFCRSCHAYVAVKIDCFECHLSTPATGRGLITHSQKQNSGV